MELWPLKILPLHIFPFSITFHSFFLPTSFPRHLSGIELLASVSLSALMACMNGWLLDRAFIVGSHSSRQNILCGLGSEVHPGSASQASSQFQTVMLCFCCWIPFPSPTPQKMLNKELEAAAKARSLCFYCQSPVFVFKCSQRGRCTLSQGLWEAGH